MNGTPTQVRTYFTGTSDDGTTFVVLLDQFFNDAFFNAVVAQIGANHFTTDALNIVLFPNTFLFNLQDGPQGALVLGFHTFVFDGPIFRKPIPVRADEIVELMSACDGLYPPGGLRGLSCATIFGLMASTGLRISEATALTRTRGASSAASCMVSPISADLLTP